MVWLLPREQFFGQALWAKFLQEVLLLWKIRCSLAREALEKVVISLPMAFPGVHEIISSFCILQKKLYF